MSEEWGLKHNKHEKIILKHEYSYFSSLLSPGTLISVKQIF